MSKAATKRSAAGAGSIRRKAVVRSGKPYTYWEARYSIGSDPGTGKQIQKSIYGKMQKEVREKLQAVSVDINQGQYFEPAKMTVGQWMDTWTANYMGDKKWSTAKHYKAQVKTHIKPALGAVKLSALAPHQIQAFYNGLLETGREVKKKVFAKSVRNIHGILTKALSVAVDMDYIKINPADRVTLPRKERKEIHPLSDEQVTALLSAADMDEYGQILKVILFTGLREAEAIGLTWDCVDFKTGRLTICKQLQKRTKQDGGFVFAPLKNDKTRIIHRSFHYGPSSRTQAATGPGLLKSREYLGGLVGCKGTIKGTHFHKYHRGTPSLTNGVCPSEEAGCINWRPGSAGA